MVRFLLVALSLVAPLAARGQASPGPWGSWFILTAQLPGTATARWGGFAEAQVRTNALLRQYFYHEYKAGVSYDLVAGLSALLGAGRYVTSDYRRPEAGRTMRELRLWQQLSLTQTLGPRLRLDHRYRVEQRWQRWAAADSAAFRWRVRYRLNAVLPLTGPTLAPGVVFANAYDELFLNPTGFFERNRLYVGLGLQLSKPLALQAGWLRQDDYRTGGEGSIGVINKNNLVLSLSYRFQRPAAAPAPPSPSLGD